MNIYVNRTPVNGPWGGGNLWVKSMYDNFDCVSTNDFVRDAVRPRANVFFIAGLSGDHDSLSAWDAIEYKHKVRNIKIVLRVNENDERKGTNHVNDALLNLSQYVDATVFVSHWLKDQFVAKGWKCKNNTVIYNGVDHDVFKPIKKQHENVVKIVTHHWSDNTLKGFDYYELIDGFVKENPEFQFTYIGREQGKFTSTRVVKPLFGHMLGAELASHDVYVSASRWDPGPNHVIEALSCGLPTYVHRDGGGAVEFAGKANSFNSWEELKTLLLNKKYDLIRADFCNWKECATQYRDFLESLI